MRHLSKPLPQIPVNMGSDTTNSVTLSSSPPMVGDKVKHLKSLITSSCTEILTYLTLMLSNVSTEETLAHLKVHIDKMKQIQPFLEQAKLLVTMVNENQQILFENQENKSEVVKELLTNEIMLKKAQINEINLCAEKTTDAHKLLSLGKLVKNIQDGLNS
eukprot:TRINITY_DN7629_c0_g1_i1.p1 TRINITY_DN7629_c0_g1~~TRINITY_DN7629_c0_g1_i1.p1  ORF type:complete len:160 (+),score=16.17 TRINITY_DN7629_c0_g1_i1:404-883(+)